MASGERGMPAFPYSLLAIRHSGYDLAMKLELLTTLNTERAARRAAIVVTDVASGEQRLVRAADVAQDPLKRRAGGAAAQRQERHGGNAGRPRLPHRLCAGAAARHHRRRPYQPGAGADRASSWATM